MKHLIRLTDFTKNDILNIYNLADEIQKGKYNDALKGKTVVLFFPDSSIRTRITFEKGIHLLGGQAIVFPPETLDKKEELRDVCGYLNNWADMVVARHRDIEVLEKMARHSQAPVINALSDENHPCEIISDLYALSKIRKNYLNDNYLFCGKKGNIGLTWKEASDVMGFELEQCCAKGYEIDDLTVYENINEAVVGKDIVCTDSLPANLLEKFRSCQVTKAVMERANEGAILNPCPPFYCGEEVSAESIESEYFAGYEFKKCLLEVQQAIMMYCLSKK